ncbi:type III PLP-dependent enzyme [Candidatus Saccharibacteria bacterium]|nr:type III PLP-dependent enzyme [Candidatus Saccharibacteria bacterium]
MEKKRENNWRQTVEQLELSDTPTMVVDANIIRKNVSSLKRALPRVKIYYAIKALSDEVVLRVVEDLVDGYDIASLGEFNAVREVSSKPILFSNPVKIPGHIVETFNAGVDRFAFDSIVELDKIAKDAPGSEVYLRLKVSDYGSAFPLSKKFGADENHAVAFFGHAAELGLKPIGITFHVGSQSENVKTWESAIETAGRVIERLDNADFDVRFLDIGGGFPGQYSDQTMSLDILAATINTALDKFIPQKVELYAEPGRYIVADAAVMVTTVIGKASRSGQDWLYLDVGVFQGLMESLEMEDWKYPIFAVKNSGNYSAMPRHFALTGPTCDAYDTIDLDVSLPSDVTVGDRVCIASTGAYTVVYGSTFNGFPVPQIVCVNK